MARTSRSAKALTDHDEIRQWAEKQGGTPARVKRTGGGDDPGILRIDFPGYSGEQSLEPISWEEFFEKFDERNLALLVRESDRFNKLVSRDGASGRSAAHDDDEEEEEDEEVRDEDERSDERSSDGVNA